MQVLSILMTRLSLTSSVLLCYMYDGNSTAAIDGWLESRFVAGSPAAVAAAAASESLDAWSAYAMNQSNIYLDWFDGDFHSGVSVDIPRYQFAPSQHHDYLISLCLTRCLRLLIVFADDSKLYGFSNLHRFSSQLCLSRLLSI